MRPFGFARFVRLLAAVAAVATAQASADDAIVAVRVDAPGPLLDPDAAFWSAAPETGVALLPQTVTTPSIAKASVEALKVRAAHNGQWLAVRIEWQDPSRDETVVTDRFGDQVALELPIDAKPEEPPSPMMGNPGGRVNILQWRAAFQHDIEHGEPDVRTLYPNALVDLYPDQVLRVTDARPYMGALGMDNPVSRPTRSPVLDQMAEGWGTLTVKPDQQADGRGVWKNGVWSVVIGLPLAGAGANAPRLSPGARTIAAFAAWNGGNREVGSRKAWSSWTPLELAK